jgi:hypothetical protein
MRARRRDVVDEYVEDGRAAVYSEQGMVVVLSELATVAWSVLGDDWMPADEVASALVAEFGAPGDGNGALALTEQALRTLAEHALVDLDDPSDDGRMGA